MKPNIFLRLISFLWPVTLEKRHSQSNKILEVTLSNDTLLLDTQAANYSFGALHKVMEKALEKVADSGFLDWQKVLVLGYGGGSAASIIRNKYNPQAQITAVEIDPTVVELAKKWFYSQDIHFEICDAQDFIKNNAQKFDLIICDLYVDLFSPPFVKTGDFYKKMGEMMTETGVFIQNLMLKHEEIEEHRRVFNSFFRKNDQFNIFGTNSVFIGHKNAL